MLPFLSKDRSTFLISFPLGLNASDATAATMWLCRYPLHRQTVICILLQRLAEGWGQCLADKSHQGVTLRKDFYVLPEATFPRVC